MTDIEHLLRQAAEEINSLRRHNELLAARVETVELLASFLHARPPEQRGVAMGEDVAWKMLREADAMKQAKRRTAGDGL